MTYEFVVDAPVASIYMKGEEVLFLGDTSGTSPEDLLAEYSSEYPGIVLLVLEQD
jgi:hypothetical protein